MKGQLFTPDSSDGFVIERVRDGSLEACYIEKLIQHETVMDPFGKESIYERIGYRQIDFTLFENFPNIELRDAHRGTREFVSRLLELCGFAVAVKPVTVELLSWAVHLEKVIDKAMVIDSLQVSGVDIAPGVRATMLLRGSDDVRPALDKVASSQKFELEKIQIKMADGGRKFRIQLTSSAAASIPEEHWDELLPVLRDGLSLSRNS
jgi:hypothetical protein